MAAAVVLVLAGCAVPADGLDPSPSVSTPVDPSAGGLVVPLPPHDPLDAYDLTSDPGQDTIDHAVALLTDDCLRGFGFEPRPRFTLSPEPSNPYALDARLGYAHKNSEHAAWQQERDAVSAQVQKLDPPSDAYLLVETGGVDWSLGDPRPTTKEQVYDAKTIPVGGCEGQANATIAGGDPFSTPLRSWGSAPLVKELIEEAGGLTDADVRVSDLVHQWSTCMAGLGFDYASPQDAAIGHVSSDAVPAPGAPPPLTSWDPDAPAGPEELATARADVTCRLQTDYEETLAGVRAEHQRRLIEDNQLALDEIAAAQDLLVRGAASVVGADG